MVTGGEREVYIPDIFGIPWLYDPACVWCFDHAESCVWLHLFEEIGDGHCESNQAMSMGSL